jgi:NTE family protein
VTEHPIPSRQPSLARFFEDQYGAGEAVSFCLAGGTPLFEAGEQPDQLYYLRTGRLAAKLNGVESPARLALINPGEPVGEMAVIAGLPHSASVVALRDSELLGLSRDAFFDAVRSDPELLIELSRLVLARVRATTISSPMSNARRVLGFFAFAPDVHARPLVATLGDSLRRLGYRTATLGSEEGPATPEWFSTIESRNDFVLYGVEHDEISWGAQVSRQVDAAFILARARDDPSSQPADSARARWSPPADLILLQEAGAAEPKGSTAWITALRPARHFHLRQAYRPDTDRLARVISDRAVGLILSGGAARAYAHVGAIRALRESSTPIDFIGGVSMGAVIGAGLAMGWDDTELDRRIRQAFVESNPVNDLTWPLVAITRGETVRQRLRQHFVDRMICDLWLPFFCVSTNLTTGHQQIHRQGLVREVLRASLSLPGVLPPVTDGDDVLVDGAILNNFPADVMRMLHTGPVIGVDVAQDRSIEASDLKGPSSFVRWLTSGGWRNGAPIVSVLMRAATVTASQQATAAHEMTDLLIQPKLDAIEIRDWKAYEPAVAEGYKAALSALASLDRPVTDLRRIPSGAE